jgi:hypothetical protein
MGWLFHASDPMGGAAGEAFANTLKSPGMHPEHVLAREAIQNSVDAGLAGAKVEVHFRASAERVNDIETPRCINLVSKDREFS